MNTNSSHDARPAADIAIDPARCPLCGGPNQCAMVQGGTSCWCFTAAIPQSVLERVPPAARCKACICASCAAEPVPAPEAAE